MRGAQIDMAEHAFSLEKSWIAGHQELQQNFPQKSPCIDAERTAKTRGDHREGYQQKTVPRYIIPGPGKVYRRLPGLQAATGGGDSKSGRVAPRDALFDGG